MEIYEQDDLKFYTRGDWDRYIIQDELKGKMYHFPDKMETVLDIGAHIGGTTILCASKGAEVYAYEPHKENFDLLVKNVELNNLQNKVHCFNQGIGGKTEKRKLWLFLDNTGMPSMMEEMYTQERKDFIWIDIIPFSEVIAQKDHWDFVKIDCEGAEYEFLLDLKEEDAKKIDNISAEIHFTDNEKIVNRLKQFYQVDYSPNPSNIFVNCKRE